MDTRPDDDDDDDDDDGAEEGVIALIGERRGKVDVTNGFRMGEEDEEKAATTGRMDATEPPIMQIILVTSKANFISDQCGEPNPIR